MCRRTQSWSLTTLASRACRTSFCELKTRSLAIASPFDQYRHERLDAQAVQRRGAVEQHRVVADDLVEDVPDLGPAALHHALGRLDVGGVALVHELAHDERLEQLERHLLGQAALVEL